MNTKLCKRIFAIISVVFLGILYGSTLVFALLGTPFARKLFLASIVGTIFVPVFLYALSLWYRLSQGSHITDETETKPPV